MYTGRSFTAESTSDLPKPFYSGQHRRDSWSFLPTPPPSYASSHASSSDRYQHQQARNHPYSHTTPKSTPRLIPASTTSSNTSTSRVVTPAHNTSCHDDSEDEYLYYRRHASTTPRFSERAFSHPTPSMPRPVHRPYSAPAPSPAPPPPLWAPMVFYQRGSLVWHAGSVWRCDTPHTSGDLAREPTESLHLWTPVGSTVVSAPEESARTQRYAYGSRGASPYTRSTPPYVPQRPWTAPASSERARTNAVREDGDAALKISYLREELAGSRVWRVGGVGVFAYAEDVRAERVRQAAWKEWTETNSEEEWLRAARRRTAAYARAHDEGRMRPLVRWHLVEGPGPLPIDALPAGREASGSVLYAARAWVGGGLEIGKCGAHLYGRCSFSQNGQERSSPFFEVLCGPADVVGWVSFERGMTANLPGWQPVEGGRDRLHHRALLVARATYKGGVHPGKCLIDDEHASVTFDGQESWCTPFEVLTYSTMFRR